VNTESEREEQKVKKIIEQHKEKIFIIPRRLKTDRRMKRERERESEKSSKGGNKDIFKSNESKKILITMREASYLEFSFLLAGGV
jgi:hypothetical protein